MDGRGSNVKGTQFPDDHRDDVLEFPALKDGNAHGPSVEGAGLNRQPFWGVERRCSLGVSPITPFVPSRRWKDLNRASLGPLISSNRVHPADHNEVPYLLIQNS